MKRNSMKRTLSAVMAITMVAGATSATAYAANTNGMSALDASGSTGITSATTNITVPIIEVSVPAAPSIKIDPYQIAQKGQIYSNKATFVNYSNIPLTIGFSGVTVKAESNSKFFPADKALSATAENGDSKWGVVSLSVTDGVNKTTSTVIKTSSDDGISVPVKTAMAPLGGTVSYEITGTCNIAPKDAWTADDKVSVTAKYSFTENAYTTYDVSANPTHWKALDKVIQLSATDTGLTVLESLPKTMSNAGKEVPIVWKYNDSGTAKLLSKMTSAPAADVVIYPCIPEYADVYDMTNSVYSGPLNIDGKVIDDMYNVDATVSAALTGADYQITLKKAVSAGG